MAATDIILLDNLAPAAASRIIAVLARVLGFCFCSLVYLDFLSTTLFI